MKFCLFYDLFSFFKKIFLVCETSLKQINICIIFFSNNLRCQKVSKSHKKKKHLQFYALLTKNITKI